MFLPTSRRHHEPVKSKRADSQTYLLVSLPEVRGQLVRLFADDVAQLLPSEVTQDALGLIEEDAAGEQALVEAVQEGQMGLAQTGGGGAQCEEAGLDLTFSFNFITTSSR